MKAIFAAIVVFAAMFAVTSAGLIGAVAPIAVAPLTTGVSYQHRVQTHHALPYAVGYGGYGLGYGAGYGLGYGYGAPLAAGYGIGGYGLGLGYGGLYRK